ncbi:MAG: YbjN domain-containing protein [Sphingobium sp.]|nr:YbjN domain-containing protein [Sphingobium sp.]MBO9669739.1 YbjN domain-containing protein [Sphingobium sp.]
MIDRDGFAAGDQEAEPIDMLAAYFEAHEWSFEHVSEDEIVARHRGSWTEYEIRAIWRDEDMVLQLLVLPDIRIADDKRAAICETLALINEQLWLGHFELWSASSALLFRHGALLGPSGSMSFDQAQLMIESAIDESERFYPVFQFVLWGGKSPAEAMAASLIETYGEA